MGEVNTYKYITIFHSKIANSLWKMVRLTQKLAYMILVGKRKKMIVGNFDISIFADFTAAEIGKKWRFLATEQPNRLKKSRKIKISKIPTIIL